MMEEMIHLDNVNLVVKLILEVTPIMLTFLGAVALKYWIPELKAKKELNTEEKRRASLSYAKTWVEIGVRSAEQLFKDIPKSGAGKKQYVINLLKEKGVEITMEELNALIESAVKELELLEKGFINE